MIHSKRVIFMIVPLLFVPLVYGMSSTPNVCALPKDPGFVTSTQCWTEPSVTQVPGDYTTTCCWTEVDAEGIEIDYCQSCNYDPLTRTHGECGNKWQQSEPPPTATPTIPGSLPEDGVLEQPEQPLFGENLPPTGGIEQPPTATTPQTPPRLPGGGANVPNEGGSAEQQPSPQAGQDDNQGGGLPPIKNQGNVPPGGGVAEQPEDDGKEDSSEGAETAGPLT